MPDQRNEGDWTVVRELRDEVRRLRIRVHDLDMLNNGHADARKRDAEERDACHRMIARLWRRQLPGWTGTSWTEPAECPDDERDYGMAEHDEHLTWRETAHLIRAIAGWPELGAPCACGGDGSELTPENDGTGAQCPACGAWHIDFCPDCGDEYDDPCPAHGGPDMPVFMGAVGGPNLLAKPPHNTRGSERETTVPRQSIADDGQPDA